MNNVPTVMEIQVQSIETKINDAYHEAKDTRSSIWIRQRQIREILEQNEEYAKNKKKLAQISKLQKIKKESLMSQKAIVDLEQEIRTLKSELKTQQLTLFTHLDEYTRSGRQAIKIDGKVKPIEKVYKIKKNI